MKTAILMLSSPHSRGKTHKAIRQSIAETDIKGVKMPLLIYRDLNPWLQRRTGKGVAHLMK